jgi:Mn2+/Fe2+ NRAMP family transporter
MADSGEEGAASAASFTSRLSSIGPGLVYMLTIMGAGDIVSNSAAGADYQYTLIWALGVTLIFRYIWVGASAKYVLVTGETLLHGYGRLGNWLIWMILAALFVFRHFYNLYLIVLLGTTWDLLFHLPTHWSSAIWSIFFSVAGFALMIWGGYSILEYFCKVLVAAKGISLIVAAALSHPDPTGILKGTFIPTIPGTTGFYSSILVLMALIGTEAGSMTNLTYPYFMYEKGWRDVSYIKQQRFDLGVGVTCIFVMGALLQIAAAGTLHPQGIKLEGPEQLVRIFSQSQGVAGLLIFALGLWGASFSTYVGATTGYALIMTDLCRSYIPRLRQKVERESKPAAAKNDPIYRWSILFWAFSPLYILFIPARPVWLALMVSAMVVVVIPVLALPLLHLTNDRKLMGKYKNGSFTNMVLLMLIAVSLYFTYQNVLSVWQQLRPLFH